MAARNDLRREDGTPGAETDTSSNTVAVKDEAPANEHAPADGSPGTTDRSWLDIVEHRTCAGCGLTATAVPREHLGGQLTEAARRFAELLRSTPPETLRSRPEPSRWSALEYGVHVRDTIEVFTRRVDRMLSETDPDLGWWDHEAAIADGSANRSDPAVVADALQSVTADLVSTIAEPDPTSLGRPDSFGEDERWGRRGVRRQTEIFTVESTVRFALHELHHHHVDARISANLPGGTNTTGSP